MDNNEDGNTDSKILRYLREGGGGIIQGLFNKMLIKMMQHLFTESGLCYIKRHMGRKGLA